MPPRLADEPRRGEEAIRGGRGPERTPMTTTKTTKSATLEGVPDPDQEAIDRLAGLLPDEQLADALKGLDPNQITGPGGLLTQLAGRVINAALEGELTDHLGYPPGQAPPGGAGNHRNGSTPKTVQTELGPVDVRTPRDREGTFEPQLVAKRQTRLAGLDEKILDLYAGGMSVRDIESHLETLYGTTAIKRDTISRVTDAVLADVEAWRTRPLERVYPIVYMDALMVKVREDRSVRTRACYLAIGVTLEGEREVLGIWWQDTEGSKFWLAVLNDLHHRGVEDVLVCCVDGLTGFPEAIEAVYPQAWVQTCIVHQIRASMRYVTYQDRKKVAAALKPVYGAVNADAAEQALDAFDETWGGKYPMVAQSWRDRWQYIIPFLSLPADLRRAVYTTNSIENLNRQIRKSIKTRGHFPDEQAATKLIYLAILRSERKWRQAYNWTGALRGLKIHFGDRLPD
jgi:transposase-like protein